MRGSIPEKGMKVISSMSVILVIKYALRLVGVISRLFQCHLVMTVRIWLLCGYYWWGRLGGDHIIWWVLWSLDILYVWVSFLWEDISNFEGSSILGHAMLHIFVCRRLIWRLPRWVLLLSCSLPGRFYFRLETDTFLKSMLLHRLLGDVEGLWWLLWFFLLKFF